MKKIISMGLSLLLVLNLFIGLPYFKLCALADEIAPPPEIIFDESSGTITGFSNFYGYYNAGGLAYISGKYVSFPLIETLNIPSQINGVTVKNIAQYAFYGINSYSSITFPDTLTNIDFDVFDYCYNLENYVVKDSNPNYSSCDGFIYNKSKTELIRCPKGRWGNVTIPSGVKKIRDNAFYRCLSLSTVTIPYSVTSIGSLLVFEEKYLEIYVYSGSYAETYAINNGYTFNLIQYNPPHSTNQLKVIDSKNNLFNLSSDNLNPDYFYQIWCCEKTDEDENCWRLIKSYSDNFDSEIINGKASKTFQIDGELGSTFKIFFRIRDTNSIIEQYSDEYSAKDVGLFRINNMTVDNLIPTNTVTKAVGQTVNFSVSADKAENNSANIIYEYYLNDNKINTTTSNTYNWTISESTKSGINSFKVLAYQEGDEANYDVAETKILVYNLNAVAPELIGEGFALPISVNVNSPIQLNMTNNIKTGTEANVAYRFSINDPLKAAFKTIDSGNTTYSFEYPGIYSVLGTVRTNGENVITDGARKTIKVNRISGTAVTLGNIEIKNGASIITNLNSVTKGETVTITAKESAGKQFSFYRLDAKGNQEIQGWSNNNVLTWKPMQSGNYIIQVRVRDEAFANTQASYEDSKSFTFNIKGFAQEITSVAINEPSKPVSPPSGGGDGGSGSTPSAPPVIGSKRTPITLTADCTVANKEDVMYRFEVYDALMGTQTIQGYSMSDSCIWIPRKAGVYTIRVLAKDANSFGYYDAISQKDVTVN